MRTVTVLVLGLACARREAPPSSTASRPDAAAPAAPVIDAAVALAAPDAAPAVEVERRAIDSDALLRVVVAGLAGQLDLAQTGDRWSFGGRGILLELGLRTGDVVEKVNGVPIGGPTDLHAAFVADRGRLVVLLGGPAPRELELVPAVESADGPDAVIRSGIAEITRADRDRMLNDPSSVTMGARIVPSIKDNVANGFKLYAIRPGSVLTQLGFQNGDTVQTVNGHVLVVDTALDIYEKVKDADELRVGVMRRGSPVEVVIRIVEELETDPAARPVVTRADLVEAILAALAGTITVTKADGGWRIEGLGDRALGLRDGDVVVAANGVGIDDADLADLVAAYRIELDLLRDGARVTVAVDLPAIRVGEKSAPPLSEEEQALLDSIKRADGVASIPRATVDKLMNDFGSMSGARVAPANKNGEPIGFKLYAIRPSSVFGKLGFENGDVVSAVNGAPTTTPREALDAYQKVKDATELRVAIVRRGKETELVIRIVE